MLENAIFVLWTEIPVRGRNMKNSSREFGRLCVIIHERFPNPATLVGGSIGYFQGDAIIK